MRNFEMLRCIKCTNILSVSSVEKSGSMTKDKDTQIYSIDCKVTWHCNSCEDGISATTFVDLPLINTHTIFNTE